MRFCRQPSPTGQLTHPATQPCCHIQKKKLNDMMLARFQQRILGDQTPNQQKGEQARIGEIQRLRRRCVFGFGPGSSLPFSIRSPCLPRARRQQFPTGSLARPARQLKCMHAMHAPLPACLPISHCSRHPSAKVVRRHALPRVSTRELFDYCGAPATSLLDVLALLGWPSSFVT